MDVSKYKALYLQETGEHLSGIEAGLLSLEQNPGDSSVLDNLFRHYHSIKGMSASMGYEPMMRLAHAEEDLLDKLRSGALANSEAITSVLLKCLDTKKSLAERVRADEPLDIDVSSLLESLRAAASGQAARTAPFPAAAPVTGEQGLKLSSVMKVEGRLFDEVLAMVGDLFMTLSSFKTLTHGSRSIEFKNGVHQLGKTVNGLHDTIIFARMLLLEDLAAGLPRLVRDLAKETGKEVSLTTEGMDISLDRTILEGLGSPLVHIIRNAVDDGIEPADERKKAGKPLPATINIKAITRKDRVVIEVSDDGKGIDREKLKAKALTRGISAGKIENMPDSELLKLICLPGLSTAEAVTSISGRGVGMDVVKDAVESFGGSLEIESKRYLGTKIIMEMPRTSSITKALLVETSGEQFLLPISRIEKVIELETKELEAGFYEYAGTEIPVVSLAAALGIKEEPRPRRTLIVLDVKGTYGSAGKTLAGLVVDDFSDEIDAYVKPLLPPISKLREASGITVLGDGRPVFLLDVPQIISKALKGAKIS
ncbi:MAG: chemotaxis protein CheW [Deltaproteobacteria bacterium]|nr:chemotaxis protein CheW [Deltaproteobacteria bacterium]